MIRKIFTVVFLTLCLMFISLTPVKANDSFNISITGVTSNGNGAVSNYSNYTDTSVTFSTELYSPGDYITYEIKVKNLGNIDAVLSKIVIEKTNNPAILFDCQEISEGDILKAGEETTFKVRVTYNSEITAQPTNLTGNITVTLNYKQRSGSSDEGGTGTNDNTNNGGTTVTGPGETVDILGVSVPNTVAYVSLYVIIFGLLLIIIAIIVIKKTVSEKKEVTATDITTINDNPILPKTNDNDAEVLDLSPIKNSDNEDIEILDLNPTNEIPSEVIVKPLNNQGTTLDQNNEQNK